MSVRHTTPITRTIDGHEFTRTQAGTMKCVVNGETFIANDIGTDWYASDGSPIDSNVSYDLFIRCRGFRILVDSEGA